MKENWKRAAVNVRDEQHKYICEIQGRRNETFAETVRYLLDLGKYVDEKIQKGESIRSND